MPSATARLVMITAVAADVLTACSQENRYVAPPPPKVTVALPVQRPITRYLEITGNTVAVNSADLVARVPGFIDQINYQDGAPVKKDTLLFTIEPEPYKVKLRRCPAQSVLCRRTLCRCPRPIRRSCWG